MLYISRRVSQATYGVVDTDDYVEEVCTWDEIEAAVCKGGLTILGVERADEHHISRIEIYQNPVYSSAKQAKMSVLKGIDVKTSGTDVVAISVPSCRLSEPEVSIRLSEYGQTVSKYVLNGDFYHLRGKLVIVLDDNIAVYSRSFSNIAGFNGNVVLDISEIKSEKTVDKIYASDRYRRIESYIRDIPDRLDFYEGVSILYNGLQNRSAKSKISDFLMNPDKVNQGLIRKFSRSFIELCHSPLVLKNTPSADMYLSLYRNRGERLRRLIVTKAITFDSALACTNDVFWILRSASTLNIASLRRLEQYLLFFEAPENIQQAYLLLCHNVTDWAYNG